jgi:ferritin-like metal-binding protein YciE
VNQASIAKHYYTLLTDIVEYEKQMEQLQKKLGQVLRDAEANKAELKQFAAEHGPQLFQVEEGKVLWVKGDSVTVQSLTDAMRV